MTSRSTTTPKGFTLIELLTVISIIGILAAILIPTIAGAITKAKQMAAGSNATSIAKAYYAYTTSSSNGKSIMTPKMYNGDANSGVAKDINDVAYILARTGLNDASLWFIQSDINLAGAVPKSVIDTDISTAKGPATSFVQTKPKAWAFVTGVPNGSPNPSTTPILWSYGLQHDGTWSSTKSPWQGKGGHIGYLDGHVEWVDGGLSTAPGGSSLVTYVSNPNPNTATVDWKNAINSGGANPSVVVNELGTE